MDLSCVQRTCRCQWVNPQDSLDKDIALINELSAAGNKVENAVQQYVMRAEEAVRAHRMNVVSATQEARKLLEAQLTTVFKNCN